MALWKGEGCLFQSGEFNLNGDEKQRDFILANL